MTERKTLIEFYIEDETIKGNFIDDEQMAVAGFLATALALRLRFDIPKERLHELVDVALLKEDEARTTCVMETTEPNEGRFS